MTSKTLKIAATAAVLVLAFGALLYSTLQEGTEYYKHVDEVASNPGEPVRRDLPVSKAKPPLMPT